MFQVPNILMFPISIASTFLTLSWNTSQSLSRDLILQVERLSPGKEQSSLQSDGGIVKSIQNPVQQYSNLDVGHKMNSYTISDLVPSTSYNVLLCIEKSSHNIPVSSLRVTTRPESYMKELGIKKDYTSMTFLAFILGVACTCCVSLSVFRLYTIKTTSQLTSSSTMDIMSSPSEPRHLARKNKPYQKIQSQDPDEIRMEGKKHQGEKSKNLESST